MQLLDEIKIILRSDQGSLLDLYVNVFDNSLSRKWLKALDQVLLKNLHLEKNYCWLGWTQSDRNAEFICQRINNSISAINDSDLNYVIDCEPFTVKNTLDHTVTINHDRMNQLHRWFEDLQGWSGGISHYYQSASPAVRWHIRQLNLLCHEYESLALSMRRLTNESDWRRPSQLMCWLGAPRFMLEPDDYELFGVETIDRDTGAVFVGVNKAVGKHHWEVFCDEGKDSRIGELTTSSLRSQTEAAADFDIEWGMNLSKFDWQKQKLNDFRQWLTNNGFDSEDKALTIGHPQVAQVDLMRSFGTEVPTKIWSKMCEYLDVYKIQTSQAEATYSYRWSDPDYQDKQIEVLR